MQVAMKSASCGNMNSSFANNNVRLVMRFGTVKSHDKLHRCERELKESANEGTFFLIKV